MNALLLLLLSAAAAQESAISRRLADYDFDASRTLEQRIVPIPAKVLDAWRVADKEPAYAPYEPTVVEKAEFLTAIGALPPRLKQVLRERVIGFYFVSGLRGNGITDWVLDDKKDTYVYMILNPAGFKKSLAEALTGREGSVFKTPGALSVDAGAGGTGMLYTVTHESAHVFDYVVGLTRYTDEGHAKATGRYLKNAAGDWLDYTKAAPASDFPTRSRLRFYGFGGSELAAAEAPAVCAQLKASPFASLYGSMNWADDAAELFLFDHLTRTLGRPYRYTCGGKVFDLVTPARKARAARVLKPLYGK